MKGIVAKLLSVLGLRGSKTDAAPHTGPRPTTTSLDVVRYEPVTFADLVARAYYRSIQPLLTRNIEASPDRTVSAPVTGPKQWRHTHETLRQLIREDSKAVDPGDAVRDAFVRAMIELYLKGPTPVSAASLATRAAEVLHSPNQLPEHMEGFDIRLTRITSL